MNSRINSTIKELNEVIISYVKSTIKNGKEENNDLISIFGNETGAILFLINNKISIGDNNEYIEYLLKKQITYLISKNEIPNFNFSYGITGMGWLIQFLTRENLIDIDSTELLLEIDEIAFNYSIRLLDINNHDFLHGAVGNAIYLIERINDNKLVVKYLEEIVSKLYTLCKRDEKGIYWVDNYSKNDELSINLSLSHGLASKIVFLSKIVELGINRDIASELLTGSIKFMLKSKNTDKNLSIFPSSIGYQNSRLGWCYGDLGISIALWQAGVVLQNDKVKQEAIEICLHTTKRRTPEQTLVKDASFCHGTAGIAHIYNRMYCSTGKIEFKKAANYWIEETLKMATFEDGLVGYKTWNTNKYENDYSLLNGITGIGLVLLSYINDEEPTWDKCLLLS
ncbi:MAG: hypothetical protein A3K10_11630 [Bacteroidetes bacterium RIFCSPLOWO2_12_FULL_31_6]|nr:MAG: hypothetical protein A3K10_11630 [Bacteroidetes bacterium RIFCSPLOWO2_12_FULL_31_6]